MWRKCGKWKILDFNPWLQSSTRRFWGKIFFCFWKEEIVFMIISFYISLIPRFFFSYSHILTFSYSYILIFSYSYILIFSYSHILTLSYSYVRIFSYSYILIFLYIYTNFLLFSYSYFLIFSYILKNFSNTSGSCIQIHWHCHQFPHTRTTFVTKARFCRFEREGNDRMSWIPFLLLFLLKFV